MRRLAEDQQELRESIFQLLFRSVAGQTEEVVRVAKRGLQVTPSVGDAAL